MPSFQLIFNEGDSLDGILSSISPDDAIRFTLTGSTERIKILERLHEIFKGQSPTVRLLVSPWDSTIDRKEEKLLVQLNELKHVEARIAFPSTTREISKRPHSLPTFIQRFTKKDRKQSLRGDWFSTLLASNVSLTESGSLRAGGLLELDDLQKKVHSKTKTDIEEWWANLWKEGVEPSNRSLHEAVFYAVEIGSLQGDGENQVEISRSHMPFFTREDDTYQKGDSIEITISTDEVLESKPVTIGQNLMCRVNLPRWMADEYELENYYLLVKYEQNQKFSISIVPDQDVKSTFGPLIDLVKNAEMKGPRKSYYY